MTMLLMLLTGALVVALPVAWGTRRHLLVQAWDRELDLAFAVADRRDMPTHRVL
ncbi:MAG: hypothetical protein WBQ50_09570 [Nocardioides sp.]